MEGNKGIVGIKDVDLNILMEMDDAELLSICASQNKYFYRICKDENFWEQRFFKRFISNIGNESNIVLNRKPIERNWKNTYMQTIIDLQRFAKDPWLFLTFILWSPKGISFSLYRDNQRYISDFIAAPTWVINNFFFLNLGPTTFEGKFYSTMTPIQLFKLMSHLTLEGTLLDGTSIYRNRDIYMGNNL
jgi:hypothetical protein